jgi:TIR domain-containing protein
MKIYLSHAGKDKALARQLTQEFRRQAFTVWLADEEIVPGENWAKKMGRALDNSDLMVILLTPEAHDSDRIRQDLEFAIMSRKYEQRVFTVFVGSTQAAGKDTPWILLKLPHCQVKSADEFGKAVKEIQALGLDAGMSHSHA